MVYRKCVLDNLLPSPAQAEQRVALEYHFKGDLQESRIEIFIEEPCDDVDVDQLVNTWAIGASWALYPHATNVLSSHRWLTTIEPLEQMTLLDLFHGIKGEALHVFLAGMDDKPSKGAHHVEYVEGQVVCTSAVEGESLSASDLWSALNKKKEWT